MEIKDLMGDKFRQNN